LAACFSFNVLPCFFALAFRGDLSDTMTPFTNVVEMACARGPDRCARTSRVGCVRSADVFVWASALFPI
jgi:hypothetical protein